MSNTAHSTQEGVETMHGAPAGEEIVRTARIDKGAEGDGNDRSTRISWAAGFFDGEGSIGIYPYRNGFQLTIQVVQVDPRPLEVFQVLFGGKVYQRNEAKRKPQWRRTHTWFAGSTVAAKALSEMLPHLRVKADEAKVAIGFQSSKRPIGNVLGSTGRGNQPLTDAEFVRQREAAERVKELKRRSWG